MHLVKVMILSVMSGCILLVSCSRNPRVEKTFPVVDKVEASYHRIEEILGIVNIIKLDDYIVLQNGSEGVDDFFFVYSCPEMEFLYSFAKKGRGPEEYMLPSVTKNTGGNTLGFRDHATDRIAFYELTDSTAVLRHSLSMKSPDMDRFFWEINMVDDSVALVKHQGYKRGATELWNIYDMEMLDSVPNTFKHLPRKLGREYYTIFDDYAISSRDGRFVIGYYMIDRMEFGHMVGNRIEKTGYCGSESCPKFHLYGDDTEEEFSIDRNIIYYENLYAGDEYVYGLYSGKRLDDTEKEHSSMIEVYTWDGEPVRLLELDVPAAYFAVDENAKTVYAVNPEVSEEDILIFRF